MSSDTLIAAGVLVVWLFLWDLRNQRRETDDVKAEYEGELGIRLMKSMAVGLVALTAALVLDGLGVPGAAVLAAAAIVALLLLFYVAPAVALLLVPWLRRRRGASDN